MKARKYNRKPLFIRYDDGKINHVVAGPEYGQPWRGTAQVWHETGSNQFSEWIEEIQSSILRIRRIRL